MNKYTMGKWKGKVAEIAKNGFLDKERNHQKENKLALIKHITLRTKY